MAPLALSMEALRLTVSSAAVAALVGGDAEALITEEAVAGADYVGYSVTDESTSTKETGNGNGRNQNKKRQDIGDLVDFSTGFIQGAGLSINTRITASAGPMYMADTNGQYRPVLQAYMDRRQTTCELTNATYWNLNQLEAPTQTGATAPNGDASWRITGAAGTASKWVSPIDDEYHRPGVSVALLEYWKVFYVRYVDHQFVQVIGKNSSHSLNVYHTFDLLNGTTQSAGSHGSEVSEVFMGAVPNAAGWYRIGIRGPHDSTSFGHPSAYLCLVDSFGAARAATTASTGSVDIWRTFCYPEGYSDDALGEVVANSVWDGIRQVEPMIYRNNGQAFGVLSTKGGENGWHSYGFGAFTETNCTKTQEGDATKVLDLSPSTAQMASIVGSSAGGSGVMYTQWARTLNINSGDSITFNFFLKPGSQDWFKVEYQDLNNPAGFIPFYAYFNVTTGQTSHYASAIEVQNCVAADGTTPIKRVFVNFQNTFKDSGVGTANWAVRIYPASGDGDDVVPFDGSVNFSVWGAILNMVRLDPNAPLAAELMPWFNPYNAAANIGNCPDMHIYVNQLGLNPGGVYMKFSRPTRFLHTGGAFVTGYTDTNDYWNVYDGGGTTIEFWHRISGSSNIMDSGITEPLQGQTTKIAYTWDTNDLQGAVNGTLAPNDTSAATIAINTIDFGWGVSFSADPGYSCLIEEILITSRRLPNQKLTSLTTPDPVVDANVEAYQAYLEALVRGQQTAAAYQTYAEAIVQGDQTPAAYQTYVEVVVNN